MRAQNEDHERFSSNWYYNFKKVKISKKTDEDKKSKQMYSEKTQKDTVQTAKQHLCKIRMHLSQNLHKYHLSDMKINTDWGQGCPGWHGLSLLT